MYQVLRTNASLLSSCFDFSCLTMASWAIVHPLMCIFWRILTLWTIPNPYSHVILPKELAKTLPKSRLLTETEWRQIGVQQSRGWTHYAIHRPEPHILLFRRPLGTDPQSGRVDPELERVAREEYKGQFGILNRKWWFTWWSMLVFFILFVGTHWDVLGSYDWISLPPLLEWLCGAFTKYRSQSTCMY